MGTRGRPKKRAAERLSKVIQVRLSPEDYRTMIEAIRRSSKEQSDWIRDALLAKAAPGGKSGDPRG